jgi:hypothetical protein
LFYCANEKKKNKTCKLVAARKHGMTKKLK